MRFPLVSRSHHEEMVGELRDRLNERQQRIAQLDRTLQRLWDIIAKQNWNTQIFDTIEELKPQVATEEPLSPEQEEQRLEEVDLLHEKSRLASIARTRPSRLGAAMEGALVRDQVRRANAARPNPNHPARVVFDAARKEAEASVQ